MLGQPDLTKDPRFESNVARLDNRAAFDEIINEVFGATGSDELIERLKGAAIAFGEVNDVSGLAKHPAIRRGNIGIPGGKAADIGSPPARINGKSRDLGPVPDAGANSKAIREEFSA